jgi:ABC-2 type transport system permease protein
MIPLLRIELYKIFRRPRTYIAFATVSAIAILIQVAMLVDGEAFVEFAFHSIGEQFEFGGNLLNGYLITYLVLQSLLVHVPLLVALVAGDGLAGEAAGGTLRLLLTKPIGRGRVVMAKFFAAVIYATLLLIWLAIVGLGLSLLLFGESDMIHLKSDQVVFLLKDDLLWRYAAAFAFAAVTMTCIAALALFLSAFADNSIGPIVSTVGIVIFFTIVSNLGLPAFDRIAPALFTTHLIGWKGFFSDPVPWGDISVSALILIGYAALFLAATIFYFNRKDIQS